MSFHISNTTTSYTTAGPLAQDLSLPQADTFHFDLTAAPVFYPLAMGTTLQSSLSGTTLSIVDGTATSGFTLNKEAGAANHTVSADLEDQLFLRNVGDTA